MTPRLADHRGVLLRIDSAHPLPSTRRAVAMKIARFVAVLIVAIIVTFLVR